MKNIAFIKNNIAMNIFVFDETQDNTALVESIVKDNGYDFAIELDDPSTPRYSTWDGVQFIATPHKTLYELGVIPIYVEEESTTN